MFKFFIAARYMKTRLIAVISAVAVACAVAITYVPHPVMEGFLTELKRKIRGISADVLVEKDAPFDYAAAAERAAELDDRVTAAAPRIEGTVIFSTGDKVDAFDYGQLIGVDAEREAAVSDFGEYVERTGLSIVEPFEMKPETLKEVVRREAAEMELGRSGVASLDSGALREKLRALGEEIGVRFYEGPEELAEKLGRKYPASEARALAAEKVKENAEILLKTLREREGIEAFKRLEAGEAREALRSTELPGNLGESRDFLGRLAEIRERPGVIVGKSLLENWPSLKVGGEIELLCAKFSERGPENDAPKTRNLIARIVGVFDSGYYEFEVRTIYMALGEAEKFLGGMEPVKRTLGLKIDDWRRAADVRDKLRSAFEPRDFRVSTWRQQRQVILDAVQRQKDVLFVILFFADIVAGFGIFITLRILVAEKIHDIGVFSAIGAGPASVMGAFLLTGLFIALVGSAAGVASGIGIVSMSNEIVAGLDWLGFSDFRSYVHEIQHLERIPVEYSLGTLFKVLIGAFSFSLIFSIYPGLLAARHKPADAIRKEFL